MIDGKFDVVFRGQIVRGLDESVVKSNLVSLFKSSPEAVDKLFNGSEVVVRKELDYATAMKYQSALKKAGALALIKEIEQKTVAAQPSQGKATFGVPVEDDSNRSDQPESQSSKEQSTADTLKNTVSQGSAEEFNQQPSGGVSQLSAGNETDGAQDELTVAEPGAQILPDKIYEKRDVDTSQLSLASVGERILPAKPPEEHPKPSIDHLKLEE